MKFSETPDTLLVTHGKRFMIRSQIKEEIMIQIGSVTAM